MQTLLTGNQELMNKILERFHTVGNPVFNGAQLEAAERVLITALTDVFYSDHIQKLESSQCQSR